MLNAQVMYHGSRDLCHNWGFMHVMVNNFLLLIILNYNSINDKIYNVDTWYIIFQSGFINIR